MNNRSSSNIRNVSATKRSTATETYEKEDKMDMSELKALISEMNCGMDYVNLSGDGSHTHLKFKSTRYKNELLTSLKEFQDEEKFCDVYLRTKDGGAIKAHKLVLASASPYFRAMFAGGFKENIACEEVRIDPQITMSLMKAIVGIYILF
jgi:hypothetical protein